MTVQQQRPTSTAMAIIDPASAPLATRLYGSDRLALLAEQVGRGWKTPPTPDELEVIAELCERNRLDVFAKPPQIYFIKRYDSRLGKDVMTPQVSVDGLRLIASRSRDYIGPGGQQWCGEDGVWRDVWLSSDPPRAARAGVLKRGSREPLWSVALWDEWAQWQDVYTGNGANRHKTGERELAPFWREKPAHMLLKVAESMILKKSFPAETNELEIARVDELHRLEVPALVALYDRIYGADEEHAFAELPPRPALNGPADQPRPAPPPSFPPTREQMTSSAPPKRGDVLEMYDRLLSQARQTALIRDDHLGDWSIPPGASTSDIIARGRALRALVAAGVAYEPPADESAKTVADEESRPADPAPQSDLPARAALWQENRRLVARAQELKISGVPTLNVRSGEDVLATANETLRQRIANVELDQRLAAEQDRALA